MINFKKLSTFQKLIYWEKNYQVFFIILDQCENNKIFLPNEKLAEFMIEIPFLKCSLQLFEFGFKVISEKLGYRVILMN